jgi:hypothetical protein
VNFRAFASFVATAFIATATFMTFAHGGAVRPGGGR